MNDIDCRQVRWEAREGKVVAKVQGYSANGNRNEDDPKNRLFADHEVFGAEPVQFREVSAGCTIDLIPIDAAISGGASATNVKEGLGLQPKRSHGIRSVIMNHHSLMRARSGMYVTSV